MDIPAYIGVKVIQAIQILEIVDDSLRHERGYLKVSGDYLAKHKPEAGGYYVRYPDGYESFSPASAFESAYRPLTPGESMLVKNAGLG